jgi:hypothetical protein
MNRRHAVKVIVGTAVGLLTGAPAKATSINVQTPLKLPPDSLVPEGLYARVNLGIEPGDLEATWVPSPKAPDTVRIPDSKFITKAQEAVNALLDGVEMDPARNVEIRFTFVEPFQNYDEMWEVKPEDFLQRRGFVVDRAMLCEINRVVRDKMPAITSAMVTEKPQVELEEYAIRRRDLRIEVQQALRSVEILVWLAPEL